MRERHYKLIRLVFVSLSITAQKFSKVNLSISHRVCKRQAACESLTQYETLFADVSFHAAVSACVTGFRTKSVIYPLSGMPLLSWGCDITFEPFIDEGDILTKHRIVIRFHVRELIVIPVFHVSVFADCTVVELRPPLDLALAHAVLVQLLDVHLFCHTYHLSATSFSQGALPLS